MFNEQVLEIVKENRVRGTIEKVYSLSNQLENMTTKEIEEASRQDHLNFFFSFLTNLLGEYEQYLQQEEFDLKKDGVSYRQVSLFLSDEELRELLTKIREITLKAAENESTPQRSLKTISTIVIPNKTNK